MNNETIERINRLKREKNAVILAHYYVDEAVQALADYVGDSFYLAKVAKQSAAEVLVFCGVSFMGESAKILNPDKTVLMPDAKADCPMAHMVRSGLIEEMRQRYEDLAVVCYINSTAELKCASDVCVTSSNAVRIVKALPNQHILFIPDQNLGRYVAEQVPEKTILLNDGYCPIHASVTAAQVLEEQNKHPAARVISHPECNGEVLALSEFVGSTAELISYVKQSPRAEWIVCTEDGVAYRLREDNPEARFYFPRACHCCPDMKLNTPEKILRVLETGENAVELDEAVAARALLPLERMLELAR